MYSTYICINVMHVYFMMMEPIQISQRFIYLALVVHPQGSLWVWLAESDLLVLSLSVMSYETVTVSAAESAEVAVINPVSAGYYRLF